MLSLIVIDREHVGLNGVIPAHLLDDSLRVDGVELSILFLEVWQPLQPFLQLLGVAVGRQ